MPGRAETQTLGEGGQPANSEQDIQRETKVGRPKKDEREEKNWRTKGKGRWKGKLEGGKKRREMRKGGKGGGRGGRKVKTRHKTSHLRASWSLWSSATVSMHEEPSSTLCDLEHSALRSPHPGQDEWSRCHSLGSVGRRTGSCLLGCSSAPAAEALCLGLAFSHQREESCSPDDVVFPTRTVSADPEQKCLCIRTKKKGRAVLQMPRAT